MRFDKTEIIGNIWLHRVADKDTERHRSITDEGRLIYAESQQKVYFGDDTDWQLLTSKYDVLTSGTKMLMGDWPLPTGWNIVSTNGDKAIILTNSGAEVGSTGGSWTISGIDQQGSHNSHSIGKPTVTNYLGSSELYTTVGWYNHVHTLVVDGLHDHSFDGTWRPKYVKFVQAEYQ